MKLRPVIFDWDGTIVDIDDRERTSVNAALASVGSPLLSIQDFVKGYYSHPYKEAGSRMLLRKLLSNTNIVERAIEAYSEEFAKTAKLTKLQRAAFGTLQALKGRGVPLAVATLRRSQALVEQEMKYLGIDKFIEVIVTREHINPELQKRPIFSIIAEVRAKQFAEALSLLQTKPLETMVVGDSWWDIRAAKKMRAISVWVKTGFGVYTDFSEEQPDIVLDSIDELLAHF